MSWPEATAPVWLQASTLLLSLGGLGTSLYLTVAHHDPQLDDATRERCAPVTIIP
jgi:hypothetical protein